jgi:N-hydroxyarylamine O-acetyltransferase
MSDDWSVAKLDLDAYLDRLGLAGEALPATGQTLARLYLAHLAAIPFENLDILLGRGIRVDLESIQAKLVGARRGGYCFEHGQLFGAVLERLGFGVDRLQARVWRPDATSARTHLTLRVAAGGQAWLSDVGFGSSPAGPISLTGSGGPRQVGAWTYDVVPGDRARTWALREWQAGEWVTQYTVEETIVYPIDIVMSNHYTSTHPDSWFTQVPVVVRREPDAIRSLLGRTYTVTRPGYVKERRELSDTEWKDSVLEVFGLTFTAAEADLLLATIQTA